MTENNLPMPDFIDIDEGTQKAAAAAMAFKKDIKPPDTATRSGAEPNHWIRWTEAAVIEDAWREAAKNNIVTIVVQMKIRAGYPNEGGRVWARHMFRFDVMSGGGSPDEKKKYKGMNDRSINAVTTLLSSTGLSPTSGGLTGKLLNFLFPVKNQPGMKTALSGKSVMINLTDSPNKGEGAKTPRQTGVETYLPDAVTNE